MPASALALLVGDGTAGAALTADPRIAGVAFTGSTEVARLIAQSLADKPGPIVPLIAETGGQNALIADSSSLPEQVVRDVVASAFNSAGQRCSALRVLFVQADIAGKVIEMLRGAMQDPDAPLLRIAKRAALEQLLTAAETATPWYGQLMTTPQTIAWFVQLNYWLQKYRVELV